MQPPVEIVFNVLSENSDSSSPPPNTSAIQRAADFWNSAGADCQVPGIQLKLLSDAPEPVIANDNINWIVFRTQQWCADPDRRVCYPPNAQAMTTLYRDPTSRTIIGADIELNTVDFAWTPTGADFDPRRKNQRSIERSLAHEFGHVLGLEHPCLGEEVPGNPLPKCKTLNAADRGIMYPDDTGIADPPRLSAEEKEQLCSSNPRKPSLDWRYGIGFMIAAGTLIALGKLRKHLGWFKRNATP